MVSPPSRGTLELEGVPLPHTLSSLAACGQARAETSLDGLQEMAEATASAEEPQEEGQSAASASKERESAERASEVARFGAIKEKKHSLEAGISLFNR